MRAFSSWTSEGTERSATGGADISTWSAKRRPSNAVAFGVLQGRSESSTALEEPTSRSSEAGSEQLKFNFWKLVIKEVSDVAILRHPDVPPKLRRTHVHQQEHVRLVPGCCLPS